MSESLVGTPGKLQRNGKQSTVLVRQHSCCDSPATLEVLEKAWQEVYARRALCKWEQVLLGVPGVVLMGQKHEVVQAGMIFAGAQETPKSSGPSWRDTTFWDYMYIPRNNTIERNRAVSHL